MREFRPDGFMSINELNSHADTCCFGANAHVLSFELSQMATVSGFLPTMGNIETPITSVAIAYDDDITNTTYILLFHQVLYIKEMAHNLISPFQVRQSGAVINETPISSLMQRMSLNEIPPDVHSILVPDSNLHITLELNGIMSSFLSRKPTLYELENPDRFPQVYMTLESPRWDPYDPEIARIEQVCRLKLGTAPVERNQRLQTLSVNQRTELDSRLAKLSLGTTTSIRRKGTVTPEELAKRWKIGLEAARRTIERMTQLGVHDFTHTTAGRRLRNVNQQLQYRRLNSTVYTDTMFGDIKSLQGNTCAQIYATDFEWACVCPMKTKADAHLTLDMLHHQFGAFHTMIPDDAKELTQAEFPRKVRKEGTYLHPVEAYTPNQNQAE
jgi:hypothetical protein